MKSFIERVQLSNLRLEACALLELGILFLPAIPAYIWLWPNLHGLTLDVVQSLVYVYVFVGTLFIGLRRWSWDELGINRRGIVLSLLCGAAFIAQIPLGYIALGFPLAARPFATGQLLWEIFFYIALVGGVEELLFRGLVFRLLQDWHGTALAVLGSSFAFALWHVGRAGWHIALIFGIGLIFALIRWRAGGILGLIFIHGVYDLIVTQLKVPVTVETVAQIRQLGFANPLAIVIGDGLMLALILYLWKLHPYFQRWYR